MSIRAFTEIEDSTIRCIAGGIIKINIKDIEIKLNRTWASIEARAIELGCPIERNKRRPRLHDDFSSHDIEPLNVAHYSCTVGEDILLERLRKIHPKRGDRYG